MAGKISQLPAAGLPLTGGELLEVVQGGASTRATADQVAAHAIAVHTGSPDPHGDRAYAVAQVTAHTGSADPHAGKYPLLTGGKISPSVLPDLAIVQYLGVVANQTAMLALTGQRGDWCSRSDTGTVFVLTADDASLIGSWQQLTYTAPPVTSVAGKLGAVTLTTADVGGLQTALDGKQPAGSYASTSHSHVIADVSGLQAALNNVSSLPPVPAGNGTYTLQAARDTAGVVVSPGWVLTGAAPLNPLSDPNLIGFFLAEDLLAGGVSWANRKPGGLAMAISRTVSRPDPGGRPLVRLSGAGTAQMIQTLNYPFSLVIGFRTPTVADPSGVMFWGTRPDSARVMHRSDGSGYTSRVGNYDAISAMLSGGPAYGLDTPHVQVTVLNGASSSVWLDGASVASGPCGDQTVVPDRLRLNDGQYGSTAADVAYGFVLLIGRPLSLSDTQGYGALAAKYMNVTLP